MGDQCHLWRPVLGALVDELASCAPSDWCSASLTIRYEEDRMRCLLSDGIRRRHAAPTRWLVTLAHDLHCKMEKCGSGWGSLQLRLAFYAAETVDVEIHARPRPAVAPPASASGGHWTIDLAFARSAAPSPAEVDPVSMPL